MQNTTTQNNPTIQNQKGAIPATVKDIIEAINNAQNILVALSKDPDIEELTTTMALTMALDAAGKNATAIFSGQMPESIEFLNPEKVFETDTNSLQDFIISLNKQKADHLRYKVEGDFVKIYITPYRTMLTEKDLQFTRGDFNVDLIIALDVKSPDDFDATISGAPKIMHNARVASIVVKSAAAQAKKFGDIVWQAEVGTLTEAAVSVIESLHEKREISKDVATALLAGLVATSERFSNEKTSPSVMNLAARLMSVGADQRAVMENLGEDDDAAAPLITPAQTHPASKEALDAAVPVTEAPAVPPEPLPPIAPAPTAPGATPAPASSTPATSAPAVLPEVPLTDAHNPDGDPNTLPPPGEMSIPKDDPLAPSASIIEQPAISATTYVDQLARTAPSLTGTSSSSTMPSPPAAPTPPTLPTPPAPPAAPEMTPLSVTPDSTPTAAPVPAPTPEPAPAPTPASEPAPSPIKGGVPTIAELERLIKNRLPLPPEFDPTSPMAMPTAPAAQPTPAVQPLAVFGHPTAQTVNPTIDSLVPPEVAAITPISPTPARSGSVGATLPGSPPAGPASGHTNDRTPSNTHAPVSTPSIAPAPSNAFQIPSF
ncbi:hypothetical protein FWG76_02135 [Candidatus Saccharibacteria bacterium]|nr:hypothetical protein [Candidatus Saccharibacteria bacterium]